MELDTNIKELSIEEITSINGGDKFMHDLGYLVGSFLSWVGDNSEAIIDATVRMHR